MALIQFRQAQIVVVIVVVEYVDDIGDIWVTWSNGRGIALIPEVDEFEIVK